MILSMVSVAIAMLCKEQGITVTGVCFVYEIFVAQNVSKLIFYNLNLRDTNLLLFCIFLKIRLKDLVVFVELLWSEKGLTIFKKLAISRAAKRLAVLTATTLMLLYFRLQIMGSQLPVFTKQVQPFRFHTKTINKN